MKYLFVLCARHSDQQISTLASGVSPLMTSRDSGVRSVCPYRERPQEPGRLQRLQTGACAELIRSLVSCSQRIRYATWRQQCYRACLKHNKNACVRTKFELKPRAATFTDLGCAPKMSVLDTSPDCDAGLVQQCSCIKICSGSLHSSPSSLLFVDLRLRLSTFSRERVLCLALFCPSSSPFFLIHHAFYLPGGCSGRRKGSCCPNKCYLQAVSRHVVLFESLFTRANTGTRRRMGTLASKTFPGRSSSPQLSPTERSSALPLWLMEASSDTTSARS
jgi:hypothetical protein